jgi:dipeptidyl aminopeptidase/acylaminoacyl peptidase
VDTVTGQIHPIALHPGFTHGYVAYAPSYSPDGTRLAFSLAQTGARADLYVANVDGSDLTRLTSTPDFPERFADWRS